MDLVEAHLAAVLYEDDLGPAAEAGPSKLGEREPDLVLVHEARDLTADVPAAVTTRQAQSAGRQHGLELGVLPLGEGRAADGDGAGVALARLQGEQTRRRQGEATEVEGQPEGPRHAGAIRPHEDLERGLRRRARRRRNAALEVVQVEL